MDTLVGGRGADSFIFGVATDSHGGICDRIVAGGGAAAFDGAGIAGGDVIDLAGIDADLLRAGDQAFVFGGSHGHGRLWLHEAGEVSYLRGNTDADAAAEFQVAILDGGLPAATYGAQDFLL